MASANPKYLAAYLNNDSHKLILKIIQNYSVKKQTNKQTFLKKKESQYRVNLELTSQLR